MVEKNDETIFAEADDDSDIVLMPVPRPWYVYLMALYAFFGVAGFARSLSNVLFSSNPEILKISYLIILLLTIVLVVNIIKMEKKYLITFGICCILLGVWQVLNTGTVLLSGASYKLAIILILFYVIPSSVMAFLSLRPKFLSIANKYRKFKKQEAMSKIAMKKTV